MQTWVPVLSIHILFAIMWHWRQIDIYNVDSQRSLAASAGQISPDAACGWDAFVGSVSGCAQACKNVNYSKTKLAIC